jgi:protein-S-isoprenylcysteine O-methyltransferase Ste14
MSDSPAFRIWPPIALGGPLVLGLLITAAAGDPVDLPGDASRVLGFILCIVFGAWNGWTLLAMAKHRTAVLPGGSTRLVLTSGPFALSRNPLYLGLIVLDAGLALLLPSVWALLLLPVGISALRWGAIVPEERYLATKFGADYEAYRQRVRRWI